MPERGILNLKELEQLNEEELFEYLASRFPKENIRELLGGVALNGSILVAMCRVGGGVDTPGICELRSRVPFGYRVLLCGEVRLSRRIGWRPVFPLLPYSRLIIWIDLIRSFTNRRLMLSLKFVAFRLMIMTRVSGAHA